jgi:hypothetical protein
VLVGGYGPDVEFIDQALRWTFDRLALDARRLAITGFSDGASHSLPRLNQRRLVHSRDRFFAGVDGAGEPQGQATPLRLSRHARQCAPN